jgi:hypothetical protein
MKHSKITLSLILLASSAFASSPSLSPSFFRSDEELKSFARNAFKILSDKGENTIDINTLPCTDQLTETQKFYLNGLAFTDNAKPIFKALKKARAVETADFIFVKCGANGVSSIELAQYDSKLTDEQYAKIKTFEKGSGGLPLQKDEIVDFLLNGNLPTPLSPVDPSDNGVPSDNSGVPSDNSGPAPPKTLTKDEMAAEIVKHVKDGKIDKSHKDALVALKLTTGQVDKLLDETGLDVTKIKAILNAPDASGPAPAPAPKTLTQDEIAADIVKLYVKNGKIDKSHKDALESLNLTTGQIAQILAETGLDATKIKAILNAPDATPAATPKPLTEAEIAKEIFGKYLKDGKINSDDVSKKAIMALGITSAQFDKLVAIDKIDSVTKIQENLKATPPASATTKINIDFAAILKIAAANAGKIVEANRDALKLLGLSAAQIDLLLTASGLDSVDKIEKLLITGTEPSNNAKTKTTEIKAETAEKGDGANGPWYTSGWVLGISGILIISAIGGGAYIITRKSNETDL